FKFYRSDARTLRVESVIHLQDETLLADCRLTGQRVLPNQAEPQVTTHFTSRVRLTRQPLKLVTGVPLGRPAGNVIEAAEIYRLYFHGPAYQVVERAWWDGHHVIGLFAKDLPANHRPPERTTIVAPRLIELCFQTSG